MSTITVQFDGMCCHIAPPVGSPINPTRRSVFPNVHEHIMYIEVYTNDVDTAANPNFDFTMYPRENSSYQRTEFRNAKIELLNVVTPPPTVTLPSFAQRVPKLTEVEPQFTAVLSDLLDPTIPSGAVAAYFDITTGVLSSGPSEHFRTVFVPPHLWPLRHLGQWVQLDVEVNGTVPVLRVTDLSDGTSRDLTLKDGADLVTIGNQTLLDILGKPMDTGHFIHYYDLSATPIIPPVAEPKMGQGLGVGCSNTQWP
jgi:hypothetical protein